MTEQFDPARKPHIDVVVRAIIAVAPETEGGLQFIDRTADLFEVLALDSMDHLGVMTEIAARTTIEIPEREYGQLRSILSLAEHIAGEQQNGRKAGE